MLFRPRLELFFAAVFLPDDFLAVPFFAELFFAVEERVLFFAELFLAELFFAELFFAELFFFAVGDRDGAGGTLAPDLRASDRPIAIACLGFLTFRPLPDFSLPFLKAFISRSTDDCALDPYFLPEAFLAAISAPCAQQVVCIP